MNGPVAVPQQVLTLRNMAGEEVSAPLAVWLGCLLVSLPPEWRGEIIERVTQMGPQPSAPLVALAR